MTRVALFIGLSLFFVTPVRAVTVESPADASLCGAFPKFYKEVIYNWMRSALIDVDSAKIEWGAEPRPVLFKEKETGRQAYGWLVDFKVNARNRFGAYTGKQSHAALIRDNVVIKTFGIGY